MDYLALAVWGVKQGKHWFIGTVMGRGGYESWMAHLTKCLQDPNFLLTFERTTDPWERSKLVGQKRARYLRTMQILHGFKRETKS